MPLDRRIPLVTLVAAASIGACVWMTRPDSSSVELARPAAQLRWPVGAHQRYAISVDSHVEIDGGQTFEHRLAGELRMQVFSRDTRGAKLGFQLEHASQLVDGKDSREPKLESFFVVRADDDGRFAGFEFPSSLEKQTRERLRGLVRMFQIVVAADGGDSWTTQEDDANGRFTAVYRVARDGSIRKSRVEYTTSSARILASKNHASLAANGGAWLETMDVFEKQRVTSTTKQTVLVTATGTLRRIADDQPWSQTADRRLAIETKAVERLAARIEQARRRPATEADRARLRELIAELDRSEQLGNFLADVQALLDECPELADGIKDRIAAGDLKELTASAMIHALRLSGSDRAQAALIAIATENRQTKPNRLRAVIDLGGLAKPDQLVSEHLWAMTGQRQFDSELANTAILALGRIGNTLRELDATRYGELSEGLQAALRAAATPGERSAVLAAIGNTGDASFQSEAAMHLAARDPQERGAAAKALGRLPESQDILRTALVTETDPYVRSRLAEGLVAQREATPESLAQANRSILEESDARTRFALARHLGDNLDAFPEGRTTLARLLETESSNRIRKYVAGRVYATR